MAHISEIQIKTAEQIEMMRAAGLVVARTLRTLASSIAPGVSTAELDRIAEQQIRAAGATPSFQGYHGYPATICASVNEEIVHGIPSSERRLREGDIVSIDCGAIVDGWHGDAAVTVGVGDIGQANAGLLEACQAALWQGLAQALPGRRLGDISHAVETSVHGQAVTVWSGSTPGTVSAARCTWTRRCRTTGGPAAACDCGRAWPWPSNPW